MEEWSEITARRGRGWREVDEGAGGGARSNIGKMEDVVEGEEEEATKQDVSHILMRESNDADAKIESSGEMARE